jgi:hypothetical protein
MVSFLQSVKEKANAGIASAKTQVKDQAASFQAKANSVRASAETKVAQQTNFNTLLSDAQKLKNQENPRQYNMIVTVIKGISDDFMNKSINPINRQNPMFLDTYRDIITLLQSIFPEIPKRGGLKSRKNRAKTHKKTRSYR